MTNFFHSFINHYAEIAAPLTDMLARRKHDKLIWDEKELKAFERLKAALISKPVLRPADVPKGYKLYCDGSNVAISAILMQHDE